MSRIRTSAARRSLSWRRHTPAAHRHCSAGHRRRSPRPAVERVRKVLTAPAAVPKSTATWSLGLAPAHVARAARSPHRVPQQLRPVMAPAACCSRPRRCASRDTWARCASATAAWWPRACHRAFRAGTGGDRRVPAGLAEPPSRHRGRGACARPYGAGARLCGHARRVCTPGVGSRWGSGVARPRACRDLRAAGCVITLVITHQNPHRS